MKSSTKLPFNVLYIPGLNSSPDVNNPKVKWLSNHCRRIEIVDTHGEWISAAYERGITEASAKCVYDFIIGTSLGGYWAIDFAASTNIPFVAINPAVYDKDYNVFRRAYGTSGLIIQSIHDNVLGYDHQVKIYDEHGGTHGMFDFLRIDTDDHRLTDVTLYEKRLLEYLKWPHICL